MGTEQLVDIYAVARKLSVTKTDVEKLVAENGIPFIRINGLVRFRGSEIDQWIINKARARDFRSFLND